MYDEAITYFNQLSKNLGNECVRHGFSSRPRVYSVATCAEGLGSTTFSLNFATALGKLGQRVVLVDASTTKEGFSKYVPLQKKKSIADVLSGCYTVSEIVQPGPRNVSILPGTWGLEKISDYEKTSAGKLLQTFHEMPCSTHTIIIDLGDVQGGLFPTLWTEADASLLLTTCDDDAVLGTYHIIKKHCDKSHGRKLHTIFNKTDHATQAKDAYVRLARSTQRFLGISPQFDGDIPFDPFVEAACKAGDLVVERAPRSDASKSIVSIAKKMMAKPIAVETPQVQASGSPLPDTSPSFKFSNEMVERRAA